MDNNTIIINAAVQRGIYTAEEASSYLMAGRELPLHTFTEWKRRGYSVKKGEKACLTVPLWKYATKKASENIADSTNNEPVEGDKRKFFRKMSHLFKDTQVIKL